MKKWLISSLGLLSVFLFFSSCKQLISGVDKPQISGIVSNKALVAPSGIKASQGQKRKVVLSWNAVQGASYYHIYYAASPDQEFKHLAETHELVYEDTRLAPGKTIYYKIQSEKFDGSLSEMSDWVSGTTLAIPVINDGVFEDTSATIRWYMGNAFDIRTNEDIYASRLFYSVTCEKEGSDWNKTVSIEYDPLKDVMENNQCTFTGLESNSTYYYTVSARLIDGNADSVETSERVNKKTLKAFIPSATEFTASQGAYTDGIELTIILPAPVYVTTYTELSPTERVPEEFPLCFVVERRRLGSNDDYNGVTKTIYYNGTLEKPAKTDYTTAPYTPGTQIKWKDTTVPERGIKYEYRIRARTDVNYGEVIGADKYGVNEVTANMADATVAAGWVCAKPNLTAICEFKQDDANKLYESGTITLNASWNSVEPERAGDYVFAIKQVTRSFDKTDEKTVWFENSKAASEQANVNIFTSTDQIKDIVIEIEDISKSEGYYDFAIYLLPASCKQSGPEGVTPVDSFVVNTITVSKDMEQPVAKFIKLTGGYKNKIEIEFDVTQNKDREDSEKIKYYLDRIYTKDGTEKVDHIGDKDNPITPVTTKTEGDKVIATYVDTGLESGMTYEYKLYAHKSYSVNTLENMSASTLGTPAPIFNKNKIAYDSISVDLDAVPGAKYYKLQLGESADFGKGQTVLFAKNGSQIEPTADNVVIDTIFVGDAIAPEIDGEEKENTVLKYTITIEKPQGYNDALLAGKKVDLKVFATSGETSELANDTESDIKSSATEVVNVIGPAATNAQISDKGKSAGYLTLTWDKVEYAAGYIVRRYMYDDWGVKDGVETFSEPSVITYYCTGSSVTIEGSSPNESGIERAKLDNAGNYTLTDTAERAGIISKEDPIGGYKKNQAKIEWGLPCKYLVIPVLNSDDVLFTDEDDEKVDFKVEYTDKENQKHSYEYENEIKALTDAVATNGYGLKVEAAKAKSLQLQTVEWKKPYYASKTNMPAYLYRTPYYLDIYDEYESLEDITWTRVKEKNIDVQIPAGANSVTYSIDDNDDSLYEYAVMYINGEGEDSFESAYIESIMALDSNGEEKNKGYLFRLESKFEDRNASKGDTDYCRRAQNDTNIYIDAKHLSGYKERVTWMKNSSVIYDWEKKKVGPTSVEIQVLNKNLSRGWQKVLELDLETFEPKIESGTVCADDVRYNSTGEEYSADFSPAGITDTASPATNTNGLLKVLRDYKHYYRIVAKRNTGLKDSDNNDIVLSISIGDDLSAYAYREITDEEFVKIALLNYAYGLYMVCGGDNTWKSANNDKTTIFGKGIDDDSGSGDQGKMKTSKESGIIHYTMKKVRPIFTMPSTDVISSLVSIGTDNIDFDFKKNKGGYTLNAKTSWSTENSYTKSINECVLIVKPNLKEGDYTGYDSLPDVLKNTLSGEITLKSTGSANLTLKYKRGDGDEKTIPSSSTKAERRAWLPVKYNDDDEKWWFGSDGNTYGWWD